MSVPSSDEALSEALSDDVASSVESSSDVAFDVSSPLGPHVRSCGWLSSRSRDERQSQPSQ